MTLSHATVLRIVMMESVIVAVVEKTTPPKV